MRMTEDVKGGGGIADTQTGRNLYSGRKKDEKRWLSCPPARLSWGEQTGERRTPGQPRESIHGNLRWRPTGAPTAFPLLVFPPLNWTMPGAPSGSPSYKRRGAHTPDPTLPPNGLHIDEVTRWEVKSQWQEERWRDWKSRVEKKTKEETARRAHVSHR